MNDQQKAIEAFRVPPELFNAVVGYLLNQPYRQVNHLVNGLERDCKAIFQEDNPPEIPPGDNGQETGAIVDLGHADPDEDLPDAVDPDPETIEKTEQGD